MVKSRSVPVILAVLRQGTSVFAVGLAFTTDAARFSVPDVSPAVYCDAARSIGTGDTNAETVVIFIHGWGGGVKESGVGFVKTLAEKKIPVFCPLFPRRELVSTGSSADDGRAMWGKGHEFAVSDNRNDWRGGGDAIGTSVSSFDVVDAMLAKLSDERLFPKLRRIVLVGFSAGGQFVGRYVAVGKAAVPRGVMLDYAVIAPSTELRLDEDEPWHYGIKNRSRYAAVVTRGQMLANLSSRRVWRGCGTEDTKPGSLDRSPVALKQGPNRYARYLGFKEYLKAFPEWNRQVSFHDIPGVGHSGRVFADPSFLQYVTSAASSH